MRDQQFYEPISIKLDELTFLTEDRLDLFLVDGVNRVHLPFQILQSEDKVLHWLIYHMDRALQRFELAKSTPQKNDDQVKYKKVDGLLTIRANGKNLPGYQFASLCRFVILNEALLFIHSGTHMGRF